MPDHEIQHSRPLKIGSRLAGCLIDESYILPSTLNTEGERKNIPPSFESQSANDEALYVCLTGCAILVAKSAERIADDRK